MRTNPRSLESPQLSSVSAADAISRLNLSTGMTQAAQHPLFADTYAWLEIRREHVGNCGSCLMSGTPVEDEPGNCPFVL